MVDLIHYDAARRELEAAASIDEVKLIRDKAASLTTYARLSRDRRLLIDATTIIERATRKLGALMREKRDAGLMATGTRGLGRPKIGGLKNHPPKDAETLAEAGIDKHLAADARKLAALDEAQFEQHVAKRARLAAALADGDRAVIKEVRADVCAAKAERRDRIERELTAKIRALPGERYGVIYADPPWDFSVRAESGLNMHARNHYPCMSLDAIKEFDVPSLAAPDCVLWLWATPAMLLEALEVMAAWGFAYKSQYIWVKSKFGTGYWARAKHEILLVGTRGNIPAPSQDLLQPSTFESEVGKHSEKPDHFAELIEFYYPHLPKIELFRRGPARKGWSAWGAEAEDGAEVVAAE